MAFRLIYNPNNSGIILVDNNTGTPLPYSQKSLIPIWSIANGTLSLQYSHNDAAPVLSVTAFANISYSSDGGATFTTPGSFADLVTWVSTYMFVCCGGGGMASGTPITNQVKVQPPVTTGAGYLANAIIGGSLKFTNALNFNSSGLLMSARIEDSNGNTNDYGLLLFNQILMGTYTDGVVFAPDPLDEPNLVASIKIPNANGIPYPTYLVSSVTNINADVQSVLVNNQGKYDLFGVLVALGPFGPTFAPASYFAITIGTLLN